MKERFKQMSKQQAKKSTESKRHESEAQKTSGGDEQAVTEAQGQALAESSQAGFANAGEPHVHEQGGYTGVGGADDGPQNPDTFSTADQSALKAEGKAEGVPEGRILEEGEDYTFEGEQVGNMVIVKEDVYRRVIPRGAKRPSYILLARAGTMQPAQGVQPVNLSGTGGEQTEESGDKSDDNE